MRKAFVYPVSGFCFLVSGVKSKESKHLVPVSKSLSAEDSERKENACIFFSERRKQLFGRKSEIPGRMQEPCGYHRVKQRGDDVMTSSQQKKRDKAWDKLSEAKRKKFYAQASEGAGQVPPLFDKSMAEQGRTRRAPNVSLDDYDGNTDKE